MDIESFYEFLEAFILTENVKKKIAAIVQLQCLVNRQCLARISFQVTCPDKCALFSQTISIFKPLFHFH